MVTSDKKYIKESTSTTSDLVGDIPDFIDVFPKKVDGITDLVDSKICFLPLYIFSKR